MKVLRIVLLIVFLLSISVQTLLADQSINVTASVSIPPQASDFQFTFNSTDGKNSVQQNQTLSYQITYGSKSTAGLTTNITLIADWSNDTTSDGTHILDYVASSATNGYNASSPVVDLTNRTITWTITSFPVGVTDQTVSFQLETNQNYTQAQSIPFTIKAKMSNQYVSLTDLTITQNYQYYSSSSTSSNPTNTPIPQNVSLTPTAILTPSLILSPLYFNRVTFTEITENSTQILITTSVPTTISISYGTSSTNFTKSITTGNYTPQNTVKLDGLSSATVYYLQINANDGNGGQKNSDIFTFTTAQLSEPPHVDKNLGIITSEGTILSTQIGNTISTSPQIPILSPGTIYEIVYTLQQIYSPKSINAVIRNKYILGVNTFSSNTNNDEIVVPMTKKSSGIYVADIQAFLNGVYEVYVRLTDTKGNLLEQKISEIKIVKPFTVLDAQTHMPIIDARVYFYSYNTKTKTFISLPTIITDKSKNPSYTNQQGEIHIVLPPDSYKADVTSFGYNKKTVTFILSQTNQQGFPIVFLQKNIQNPLNFVRYVINTTTDVYSNSSIFLQAISLSFRFFNLLEILVIISFISLAFYAFSLRMHIAFSHLPGLFLYYLHKTANQHKKAYFIGIITDSHNKPLSQVNIDIIDGKTKILIVHTKTNKFGKFYMKNICVKGIFSLLITKEGYQPEELVTTFKQCLAKESLHIILKSAYTHENIFRPLIIELVEHFIGLAFEFFLLVSIVLEFFFLFSFGFWKTLPFFLLSIINIFLWVFFLYEHVREKHNI
jgi:hypothetical protein